MPSIQLRDRPFLIIFILLALLFQATTLTRQASAQSSADSLWTFSEIRADTNNDQKLDHLGKKVKIGGIANIQTGLLHEHYLQTFVQNDSAGMSIFAQQIDTPFERGDSVVAFGEVQRYNGLSEVHVDSYKVFKGNFTLPEAKPLEKAVRNPHNYLGMVVAGKGKIIEKGSTFNGRYLRLSPSDTSSTSIMVYVSNFHRLSKDFDFGVLSIGDKISIEGVVTEYNPEYPEEQTYKVFLRTPEDLQYSGIPRYYWYLSGGLIAVVCIFVVGWIVSLRRQVDSKTEQIQQSLEEKEVLLREIHHRVKNNLSIISGLIELQLDGTEDEKAEEVLKNSQSRIRSMALIHDKLYQTDTLSDIQLESYLQELVEAIHDTFTEINEDVKLRFDMDSVAIDIDRVIPCGLLVNELVVNSFKHAFSNGRQGTLSVKLQEIEEGTVELTVADDGPGLPEEFTLTKGDSLGSMLIKTFAAQLEAETSINGENGARFTFTFPLK